MPSIHSPKRGGLCLSRRPGEKILIGDDIEVTVVEMRDNKVRLHIRAPLAVKLLRSELLRREPERIETAWCSVDTADPIVRGDA